MAKWLYVIYTEEPESNAAYATLNRLGRTDISLSLSKDFAYNDDRSWHCITSKKFSDEIKAALSCSNPGMKGYTELEIK